MICKLIVLIGFLAGAGILHGQDTPPYQPGIYLSFEEFLNNSPSRKDTFEVISETEMTVARAKEKGGNFVQASQQSLTVYRLKDKNGKNIKGFRDFWGFSDGWGIYVNSTTHTKADHFVKLQLIGPLCYFLQLGNDSGFKKSTYYDRGDIRQTYPTVEPTLYHLEQYIFDMKSGQINKLSKKMLLEIVSPYSDLVETTNKLHKREIFLDIVRLYNYKVKSGT